MSKKLYLVTSSSWKWTYSYTLYWHYTNRENERDFSCIGISHHQAALAFHAVFVMSNVLSGQAIFKICLFVLSVSIILSVIYKERNKNNNTYIDYYTQIRSQFKSGSKIMNFFKSSPVGWISLVDISAFLYHITITRYKMALLSDVSQIFHQRHIDNWINISLLLLLLSLFICTGKRWAMVQGPDGLWIHCQEHRQRRCQPGEI